MAERYWISGSTTGGGSGNWSSSTNWSNTSGGGGGAAPPSSLDNAHFDGNGINKCVVDMAVSVIDLNLGAGYTGAGADDGHFDNATNDQSIIVSGNMTADNKTLSMGTATWTVSGNWDHKDVGTFNSDLGTLVMDGTTKTLTGNQSKDFWNLTISGTVTIASGTTTRQDVVGTLLVSGTLTLSEELRLPSSTGDLKVTGTGTIDGGDILRLGAGAAISQQDGTISTGQLRIEQTHAADIVAATYASTTVRISGSGGTARTFTPAAGTYTFTGDVIFRSGGSGGLTIANNTNNPSFVFQGDVTLQQTSGTLTWTKGTGTITLSGTSAQALNWLGKTLEDLDVDKSSGTATWTTGTTKATFDSFVLTSGTVDFNNVGLETTGAFNVTALGQLVAADGALITVGGNLTLSGESGDLLVVNNLDFDVTGTTTAVFSNVTDSDASAGTAIDAGDGTSTDNGGNVNWNFAVVGAAGLDRRYPRGVERGVLRGVAA